MRYLADTNILLRWADPRNPTNPLIQQAVETLLDHGDSVYVTPQCLVEFWNVWTRPIDRNGYGSSPDSAAIEVDRIRSFFRFAEDTPFIFGEWLRLVREAGVSGVKVHDTRIVAVMLAHGITHLLTLNPRDFARFPDIVVVEPRDLAGGVA